MSLKFCNLFFVEKETFPEERQQVHEENHQEVSWAYYCTIAIFVSAFLRAIEVFNHF